MPGKISNKKMAELMVEQELLKTKIEKLERKRSKIRRALLEEMTIRGAKAEEIPTNLGMGRINKAEPETVKYFEDLIEKAVERGRIPKKLFKKMFNPPSLNPKIIESMVLSGEIKGSVIAKCCEVEPGTPYVTITFKKLLKDRK